MGSVNYQVLGSNSVKYIGSRNDTAISNANYDTNSYFNIDMQQSAYFTMLIEGFEYNRYHSAIKSTTSSMGKFDTNESIYWLPLKSMQYSEGGMENLSIPCGVFADLPLPFRKHCPTLTCECYDHRSDFFEMKLREWHTQSVVTQGFVPVLDSIVRNVEIRSYATNGEINSHQVCQCILVDDISVSRSYEDNGLKSIQFKLIVVGY